MAERVCGTVGEGTLVESVLVGERPCASEGGEVQGAVIGGGRFSKDEELYEEEDEEGDGGLAEEEALREGETMRGCERGG